MKSDSDNSKFYELNKNKFTEFRKHDSSEAAIMNVD